MEVSARIGKIDMRQFVDILQIPTSRPRPGRDYTRSRRLAEAPRAADRAPDPVLPAHLGRVAHSGERGPERSRRSRSVLRPPGAGGGGAIPPQGRRRRRYARPHPHRAERRATGRSDPGRPAGPGNLAGNLSVRASARPPCAGSRHASDRGLTRRTNQTDHCRSQRTASVLNRLCEQRKQIASPFWARAFAAHNLTGLWRPKRFLWMKFR